MTNSLQSDRETAMSITEIPSSWSFMPAGETDNEQDKRVNCAVVPQMIRSRRAPGRSVKRPIGQPGKASLMGHVGPPQTHSLRSYLRISQNVTFLGDGVCTKVIRLKGRHYGVGHLV